MTHLSISPTNNGNWRLETFETHVRSRLLQEPFGRATTSDASTALLIWRQHLPKWQLQLPCEVREGIHRGKDFPELNRADVCSCEVGCT